MMQSPCDARQPLSGHVLLDGAYLGGERTQTPGTAGRGSPNKVLFVAAVSIDDHGHLRYAKMTQVPGFTLQAIAAWAQTHLRPGTDVVSDGLACFAGVIQADCAHSYIVVGQRKPDEVAALKWVNVILGNLKMAFAASYKGFKYASTPATTSGHSPTASTTGSICMPWSVRCCALLPLPALVGSG